MRRLLAARSCVPLGETAAERGLLLLGHDAVMILAPEELAMDFPQRILCVHDPHTLGARRVSQAAHLPNEMRRRSRTTVAGDTDGTAMSRPYLWAVLRGQLPWRTGSCPGALTHS